MKITERGPDRLVVVTRRPHRAIVGVAALHFVLLACCAFAWQPFRLACHRGGDCTLERGGLRGAAPQTFPAADLVGAGVPGGQLVVGLRGDRFIKLGNKSKDTGAAEGRAALVRAFIAGEAETLRLDDGDPVPLRVFALGLVSLVLVLGMTLVRRRLSIFRHEGRIELQQLWRRRSWPLAAIGALDSDERPGSGRRWRVTLRGADGKALDMWAVEADDVSREAIAALRAGLEASPAAARPTDRPA